MTVDNFPEWVFSGAKSVTDRARPGTPGPELRHRRSEFIYRIVNVGTSSWFVEVTGNELFHNWEHYWEQGNTPCLQWRLMVWKGSSVMTGDDSHLHPLMTIHHLSFHPAPSSSPVRSSLLRLLSSRGRRTSQLSRRAISRRCQKRFQDSCTSKMERKCSVRTQKNDSFWMVEWFYGANPCCCKNVMLRSRYEQIYKKRKWVVVALE